MHLLTSDVISGQDPTFDKHYTQTQTMVLENYFITWPLTSLCFKLEAIYRTELLYKNCYITHVHQV